MVNDMELMKFRVENNWKLFAAILMLTVMNFTGNNLSAQNSENVEFQTQFLDTPSLNDIWGWEKDGKEYAIAGSQLGTFIFDVTENDTALQVYEIPGAFSIWRDIKTFNNHAYVVDDQAAEGIVIIDLSAAPDDFTHTYWSMDFYDSTYVDSVIIDPILNDTTIVQNLEIDTIELLECHNIFIEEKTGFAYLFGCDDIKNSGVLVFDLNIDPKEPVFVGIYDDEYVHDGFVRGDTLYTSEIFAGQFSVVDFSDKSNPEVLARQSTSGNFTHNCWLSDDGNVLYTTDEISGGFIAAYNISNLEDIQLLDLIQSSFGQQVIPHNTFVINEDWLVTSYYKDGVVIHDVSDPENIIEVGSFDTSSDSGSGFGGAWGVYPYLPSGRILVSDRESGLWVLDPTYVEAARLLLTVVDATSADPINGVSIQILDSNIATETNTFGQSEFGTGTTETISILLEAENYESAIFADIDIVIGEKLELTVELNRSQIFDLNVSLEDVDGNPIADGQLFFTTPYDTISGISDANGNLFIEGFASTNYEVLLAAWGYQSRWVGSHYIGPDNTALTYQMTPGYYDDFELDFGWILLEESEGANWEIGDPRGWIYDGEPINPSGDVTSDVGKNCLVTGASRLDENGLINDVGKTSSVVSSPTIDLSETDSPVMRFHRWFANAHPLSPTDSLFISLTNGTDTALVDVCYDMDTTEHTWHFTEFLVEDYLSKSNNMHLICDASFSSYQSPEDEVGYNTYLEAGLDVFQVLSANAKPVQHGAVLDLLGRPIEGAIIEWYSQDSTLVYSSVTNTQGRFVEDEVPPGLYTVTMGKWGHRYEIRENHEVQFNGVELTAYLSEGYSDDFAVNQAWTIEGDESIAGNWSRNAPSVTEQGGIIYNPGVDSNDAGSSCYITGNGLEINEDDVDPETAVVLRSPPTNLTNMEEPFAHFDFWWATDDLEDDAWFQVDLLQGGSTFEAFRINADYEAQSQWVSGALRLNEFIDATSEFQLQFWVSDGETDALVEAGVDAVFIQDSIGFVLNGLSESSERAFKISPNPVSSILNIDAPLELLARSISIYDLEGKLLKQYPYSAAIDVAELPNGAYFSVITSVRGDKFVELFSKF